MIENDKKRIEDYINTYRLYPDEYTGTRDKTMIRAMDASYRYDPKENTITRLEGKINDNGDFEIIGLFKFPLDRPEEKTPAPGIDIDFIRNAYNQLVINVDYEDKAITPGSDRENWTIKNMVSEIDYLRSTYYDKNHPRSKLRETDPDAFRKHTNNLRRFIRKYKGGIL